MDVPVHGRLRLAPGGIAVKTENDAAAAAEQFFDVVLGHRRAQGGDGIHHPVLGHGQDVHVALHHVQPFYVFLPAPGLVQAVQLAALVEDGGLR